MSNWTKKLHELVTRIQEDLSCAAAIIVQLDTLSISSTLDSKTIQKYTQCCYSATTGSYANDTIYCRKNVQADTPFSAIIRFSELSSIRGFTRSEFPLLTLSITPFN